MTYGSHVHVDAAPTMLRARLTSFPISSVCSIQAESESSPLPVRAGKEEEESREDEKARERGDTTAH